MNALKTLNKAANNNKNRTILGNITEFVSSVQNYFAAKKVNKAFEQNYQRVVAQSALALIKQQRVEREEAKQRLNALTQGMSETVETTQKQAEEMSMNILKDQQAQLEQYEKHLEEEIEKHKAMLKQQVELDAARQQFRNTGNLKVVQPMKL